MVNISFRGHPKPVTIVFPDKKTADGFTGKFYKNNRSRPKPGPEGLPLTSRSLSPVLKGFIAALIIILLSILLTYAWVFPFQNRQVHDQMVERLFPTTGQEKNIETIIAGKQLLSDYHHYFKEGPYFEMVSKKLRFLLTDEIEIQAAAIIQKNEDDSHEKYRYLILLMEYNYRFNSVDYIKQYEILDNEAEAGVGKWLAYMKNRVRQ